MDFNRDTLRLKLKRGDGDGFNPDSEFIKMETDRFLNSGGSITKLRPSIGFNIEKETARISNYMDEAMEIPTANLNSHNF